MVLRPTLLPLPVEPAMSRCGIAARSETTGLPVVSLPRARGSRLLASTNSAETRISRRYTVAVSGFGTSTATVPRPGIGPMMRTAATFMARARSSERFTTWLTLTPAAGSNSYEVMTGPGLACTMCPSTPKSWSLRLSVLALASSSSRVRLSSEAGGGASRPTAGSWKAWAPPLPKSKVSCQARPLSTSVDFSLVGSFTTSGGGAAASSTSSPRGHAPGGAAAASGRPAGAPARPMARAGGRMRRTRIPRARDSTVYGICVTKSTPSGTRASRMIHVPIAPTVSRSASDTLHPRRPPLSTRMPETTSEARARMPVALTSRRTSPASAGQPVARRGRMNAAMP